MGGEADGGAALRPGGVGKQAQAPIKGQCERKAGTTGVQEAGAVAAAFARPGRWEAPVGFGGRGRSSARAQWQGTGSPQGLSYVISGSHGYQVFVVIFKNKSFCGQVNLGTLGRVTVCTDILKTRNLEKCLL